MNKRRFSTVLSGLFLCWGAFFSLGAQEIVSYNLPKEYQIADIEVSGVQYLDHNALIHLSGLVVGQRIKIPGDEITSAIDKLWKQGLFENIQIKLNKVEGQRAYIGIEIQERPRLQSIVYEGVKSGLEGKIKDEVKLKPGDVVTDYKLAQLEKKILKILREKGFLNADVLVVKKVDPSSANGIILVVKIDKKERVKILHIDFEGNTAARTAVTGLSKWQKFVKQMSNISNKENLAFTDKRLRKTMKNTKQKAWARFWKRSKYVEEDFKEDLKSLKTAYNKEGFRDFKVLGDSIYTINDKLIGIKVKLYEGDPYYFGDINFVGNRKYTNEQLKAVLNIQKGEIYNEEKFTKNFMMNPNGLDINSLYVDDGYLFFNATPVETRIYNDTIDMEIRIVEGQQSRFNEIKVKGNTRTNDYVILRETRTVPGQLFSRTEVINSINALRQLRYFSDETLNPEPQPQLDGSTNLEYQLEEVGSDQLELSGGWGGGTIVGTIGVSFNNFSLKNMFKKGAWKPLPSGDGQQLSLRAQSNGTWYWSVAASFTEPWLSKKKPLSLSLSYNHSMNSNGLQKNESDYGKLDIDGASIGLGQRLKWPDDFFMLYQSITYQRYKIQNYEVGFVNDGVYNNISYTLTLSRQNLDATLFPKTGSTLSLSVQLAPPYSLLGSKAYLNEDINKQFEWLEYYKIGLKAGWYFNPVADLVFNARIRLGYMGTYSSRTKYPPFERFYLGGDGLTGFAMDGRELIGMRGYTNNSLSSTRGATAYAKLTMEARYPITTNPVATIYALAFFEAGNSWEMSNLVDPFKLYKSAGVGLRLFLSAMGMFGLDWGYGFDAVPGSPDANKSQFHFSINQSLDW